MHFSRLVETSERKRLQCHLNVEENNNHILLKIQRVPFIVSTSTVPTSHREPGSSGQPVRVNLLTARTEETPCRSTAQNFAVDVIRIFTYRIFFNLSSKIYTEHKYQKLLDFTALI
jgi:Mg2+ and Co2+ transporter CorA|uniref:Uncharacterized protein n=1 Tax=Coptotermes formosanus TaxID=36987 RepID=R4UJK6_COPFO|nr:hypothetical protein [Coptotermes formosanus]